MTTTFKLSAEEFQRGYNANFIPYLEFLKHSSSDYISWAGCELLLNMLFPNVVRCNQEIEYLYEEVQEYDESSSSTTKYENIKQDDGTYKAMVVEKTSKSSKTPCLVSKRVVGINIITTLMDKETGALSEQQTFPVMNKDGKRSGATAIDSRLINDNKQRAFVRAVASVTGIGLRLWTREGMDTMGGNKNHMLFSYLQRISTLEDEYSAKLGLPDDYEPANFGMSIAELTTKGKFLSEKLKESK